MTTETTGQLQAWLGKAWDLYGHGLGGSNNQHAIAEHLASIAKALENGGDIDLTLHWKGLTYPETDSAGKPWDTGRTDFIKAGMIFRFGCECFGEGVVADYRANLPFYLHEVSSEALEQTFLERGEEATYLEHHETLCALLVSSGKAVPLKIPSFLLDGFSFNAILEKDHFPNELTPAENREEAFRDFDDTYLRPDE